MNELLNAVECVIEQDCHIAKEPIGLSCGHCICKECIPKNGSEVWCKKCKSANKNDLKINSSN